MATTQAANADIESRGKDLYEIGDIPPLGHVPANMYAWTIRKERHGEPITAMQQEVVPTPVPGDDEVLVLVIRRRQLQWRVGSSRHSALALDLHKQPYHIAGSDASALSGPSARR
ncbi:MAG: hypothetical protein R3C97_02140 [Geminicoccaceae bacterium]